MADPQVILLFTKILTGTAAAFFGIFFLAYTRDAGWMAVILAAVVQFIMLMFETLRYFGIISPPSLLFGVIPLSDMVLQGLPSVCLSVAFLFALARRRKR
ncbi:MAG: hypothetical protein JXB03_07490 [Spirochaetales bacterium]|nr:hypothetical protein [Spirochaetales bacterium]